MNTNMGIWNLSLFTEKPAIIQRQIEQHRVPYIKGGRRPTRFKTKIATILNKTLVNPTPILRRFFCLLSWLVISSNICEE